ncbi:aminoglycoside phosphotransferase family protein [Streptomyces sp. P6-2-1]|uniref:aminoglycoside phosphotransferase family protein n=1 Tax=unclassified Streptomyces TaxID=2593676 RepID=UPI003D3623E2
MPAAEVSLTPGLVRELLTAQHPDLAALPLAVLAHGWDNDVWRLGTSYLVRLPRRAFAADLVLNEQRWLPSLAARLPLPVPAPVREGVPGCGYPWAWSVVPYLPGGTAAHTPPADAEAAARALGAFLGALHTPAPADAPVSAVRGVPLARRAARVAEDVAALGDPTAQEVWRRALAAPAWSGPPLWVHGDLHPANVLVHKGRLSGVVDFGDLTSGDPATDLAAAWMLFPRAADRAAFRAAHGRVDEAAWTRARGWALALGLVFVTHSADNPLMAGVGKRTLEAVLGS